MKMCVYSNNNNKTTFKKKSNNASHGLFRNRDRLFIEAASVLKKPRVCDSGARRRASVEDITLLNVSLLSAGIRIGSDDGCQGGNVGGPHTCHQAGKGDVAMDSRPDHQDQAYDDFR